MANSYYPLQAHKNSRFILLLSIVTLPMLVNSEKTSFSFNKFTLDQENLVLQGDAFVSSATGRLQLTDVKHGASGCYSGGRALYSSPIHIWDSNTQAVASFFTSFKFVMNTPNPTETANGFAFFLAPVNTQLQKQDGYLGLFDSRDCGKNSQTLAVEFDTFHNYEWDPKGQHIGINVNSIQSVETTPWNLSSGQEASIFISYNAPTKSLTVHVFYCQLCESYSLKAVVDLKDVLPQWVRVGFSATNALGHYVETQVLSWSFSSKLPEIHTETLRNMDLSDSVLHKCLSSFGPTGCIE